MKVQFVLEFAHELVDEEKFSNLKVVETYRDPEMYDMGYEVIEVEVLGIWEVKIIMGDGKTYIAEDAMEFMDGDETKWFVRLWDPVEE